MEAGTIHDLLRERIVDDIIVDICFYLFKIRIDNRALAEKLFARINQSVVIFNVFCYITDLSECRAIDTMPYERLTNIIREEDLLVLLLEFFKLAFSNRRAANRDRIFLRFFNFLRFFLNSRLFFRWNFSILYKRKRSR